MGNYTHWKFPSVTSNWLTETDLVIDSCHLMRYRTCHTVIYGWACLCRKFCHPKSRKELSATVGSWLILSWQFTVSIVTLVVYISLVTIIMLGEYSVLIWVGSAAWRCTIRIPIFQEKVTHLYTSQWPTLCDQILTNTTQFFSKVLEFESVGAHV